MKIKKHSFLIFLIFFQAGISFSFTDKDDFFSIIILPDTQHYSSSFPEMFYKQMNWIVELFHASISLSHGGEVDFLKPGK